MLRLIKIDFSDCTVPDFNHYFQNTLMVWKITPTKNRIYNVLGTNVDGIEGQYLTKEGEWLHRNINWAKWWEVLYGIPHNLLGFNSPGGCSLWRPNLLKNLKKSIKWGPTGLSTYGKPTMEEQSSQQFLGRAFPEIYRHKYPPITMNVWEAINSDRSATITENFFIVTGDSVKKIYFKQINIGKITKDIIVLDKRAASFREVLVAKEGVPREKITIAEKKAS